MTPTLLSPIRGSASGEPYPLDLLFAPRTVAVFVSSDAPGSVGQAVMSNLIRNPFGGMLFPICPGRRSIHGVETFPNLAALPRPVDLALVAAAAHNVPDILDECLASEVKAAIVLSAAPAGAGQANAELERHVRQRLRPGGMRILGPGSFGVACTRTGLNATFATGMLPRGKVGFLSQGGDLLTALLHQEASQRVGCSAFVSFGSLAEIPWADWLGPLAADEQTECLGVFVERLPDARAFFAAVREVTPHKPVLLLRGGREGPAFDKVFEEACRCSGVLHVHRLADFFRLATLLTSQPVALGRRLAILANSHGPAVLAANALRAGKGQLAPLAPLTVAQLGAVLGANCDRQNPIEIGAGADAVQFSQAASIALFDPNVDALLVLLGPEAALDPLQAARGIHDLVRIAHKPVLACWMWGTASPESLRVLRDAGIPTFHSPEAAIRAFGYLWQHTENLRCVADIRATLAEAGKGTTGADRATQVLSELNRPGLAVLEEDEVRKVLSAYGLPLQKKCLAGDADEAIQIASALGYPVLLSLASDPNSRAGGMAGIRLEAVDEAAVRRGMRTLLLVALEHFGATGAVGVAVQPLAPPGAIELALASTTDPQLGPVIRLGEGGPLAGVSSGAVTALAPLTPLMAREMIQESPVFAALRGPSGDEPFDAEALEEILLRFSQLVVEQPWIREVVINPLVISRRGVMGCTAIIVPHNPEEQRSEAGYYARTNEE